MRLARYWAKIDWAAQTRRGKSLPFSVWRGSPTSKADAERLAREAAERIGWRIENGEGFPQRYAYAERPLREEILQEIRGPDGDVTAAITRNSYGADVLNAARLLFIDVDLLDPSAGSPLDFLTRALTALFGLRRAAPVSNREVEAHARRRQWLDDHPHWGMRVYQTRSGLRYLVTHAPFEPGEPESEAAMEYLGCDPAYLNLCRSQKTFRARLTPKPWRCHLGRPPVRFPFETADEERRMRDWQAAYAAACAQWATCKLLEVCGNPQVHAALTPLLKIHDERTRAESDLPLA